MPFDARQAATHNFSPRHTGSDQLPVALGAIFAAYGISLVFVAITLLALSSKRRQHLTAEFPPTINYAPYHNFPSPARCTAVPNFSYPSPVRPDFGCPPPISSSSNASPVVGIDYDDNDIEMAEQQLEDMYKHAMEHEAARLDGQDFVPSPSAKSPRPSHLTLDQKPKSKAQGFLDAIRTPRKKNIKGINISSPIMSPHPSPRPSPHPALQYSRPLSPVSPSSYGSSPATQSSYRSPPRTGRHQSPPLTPEISPKTIPSIDEHLNAYLDSPDRRRAPPPVGLPRSPKPGAGFPRTAPVPTLGTVRRPSAVREGGLLPLRAYDPGKLGAGSATTIQTVLERKEPEGPMTGRSPLSAGAVPYSPYQPYTPCVPITPSLVTKEDRKRMKKMTPKSPTVEMVKSTEDVW
ncbi:hypothetical protein CP532_6285 [Ophiocordyceps camponoti-leonardi (nom. inval.)]|nr:hypothetical protein CP532_6285 [Ophiocordyceps camponoti-leonardi (nom. inval.)]